MEELKDLFCLGSKITRNRRATKKKRIESNNVKDIYQIKRSFKCVYQIFTTKYLSIAKEKMILKALASDTVFCG